MRQTVIAAIVVFALVAIGLFYWVHRTNTPASAPSNAPPTPTISLTTTSDKLVALPTYGHIDAIRLVDDGRAILISGWIAPPLSSTVKSFDKIIVALDVPAKGAALSQAYRPDVVQAKVANSFYTGFDILVSLLNPLQALPTSASLCVVGSSAGALIVRASDHKEMQCP